MDNPLQKLGSDTQSIRQCIICADSRLISDNRYKALLGLIEPFGIKKCLKCGLRWLSPRPTEKGYSELYKYETYFEGHRAVESYSTLAKKRKNYFIKRLCRIEKMFAMPSTLKILDIGAATVSPPGRVALSTQEPSKHRSPGLQVTPEHASSMQKPSGPHTLSSAQPNSSSRSRGPM